MIKWLPLRVVCLMPFSWSMCVWPFEEPTWLFMHDTRWAAWVRWRNWKNAYGQRLIGVAMLQVVIGWPKNP